MTLTKTNRIAVFVDAENVTNWIKHDGISLLISELQQIGQIIIRRAYGVWSRPALAMHQSTINQHGFELIHCYHPVTGKNTADIQMTVDVIECAWQLPNINYFVLVTGDSDFTPVFRRLREMDKEVIGVGQHSTLSECVKTSCSRFIYTDEVIDTLTAPNASVAKPVVVNSKVTDTTKPSLTQSQANSMVIAQLKSAVEPINICQIKNTLKQKARDFDEGHYGFKNFTDFVKAIDGVQLTKKGTINFAHLANNPNTTEPKITNPSLPETYKNLLKKHNAFPDKADILKTIYKHATAVKDVHSDPATLREAIFAICHQVDSSITKTTINKAFSLFIRMDLVHTEKAKGGIDAVRVRKVALKDFLLKSDKLVIAKLLELKKVNALELKSKEIKKITLSSISKDAIKKLIGEK
jgi:uncharacterized protein (TIGR00288 family)